MNLFSKSKEKEELVLVFDVSSSSVGAALFFMQSSGTPRIIYSIREQIPLEDEISFERLFSLTIKTLGIIVNKACMVGLGAPKRVYCILSSPWYASQTRNIFFQKNEPFIFTSKIADSLIQKEIDLFEEENLKNFKETRSKIKPIELKNMCTMLNGYATSNPLNQKTKDVEMTIFISMSPEEILEKIKETINKHFHNKDICFSSSALTSFAVSRDIFIHQENFLLVDIGGEVTEVSMVKKDTLRSAISFPLGSNFMIRSIAEELNCSLTESRSYLSLYKDGHAEDVMQGKLGTVVGKLRNDWLLKFQESLINISNDISLPSTIFLTTEKELGEFLTETIKNEQYNQYTLTDSKFKVIFLGSNTLHGIATLEGKTLHDPALIIEAIYINRFLM